MLGNVVTLEPPKRRHRVVQASGSHAPGANGCTYEVDGLGTLRQPFAEQEAVQRAKNQTRWSASRTRNGPDLRWLTSVTRQRAQRRWPRIDT